MNIAKRTAMSEHEKMKRPVDTTLTSIRILESLKRHDGMTLEELTDYLEFARSTIHRHLLTLEQAEFINRRDGAYYVGLRLFDFGIQARNKLPIYDIVKDHVDNLADRTGEIVWLISKDHDHAIYLYKAGEQQTDIHSRLGVRRHLHQLAAGKAILANLSAEKRREIIERQGLPTLTENTVTEPDRLSKELATIRKRGFAFNRRESVRGLNAVAAPIQNDDGYPLSAISISGPASRLQGDFFEKELPNELLAAIDTIQIQMQKLS